MQVRSQITLLAIVAAVMSIVRWVTNSPFLPVGDAPTSAANKEVEKADMQQHRKKRGTYHHYDDEICQVLNR